MNMVPDKIEHNPMLEKALEVFLQYGYRKTSLDQIAQAAGFSRQTLYQRYKSKQNLFKVSVIYFMESSLYKASLHLKDEKIQFEKRLFETFNLWGGHCMQQMHASAHLEEIISVTNQFVGAEVKDKQQQFIELISNAIEKQDFYKTYQKRDIPSSQIANTLYFCHKGMMYICKNYGQYQKELAIAIKIVCVTK